MERGKIIVIVAPSGTGKSTLIHKLREEVNSLKWSVSYTTRSIRPGEEHGVNYFFISNDEFEDLIEKGEFIEWAKVHSNYYGTSKSFVEEGLSKGDILLFDLDVQGADAVKKHFKEDSHIIFIEPPSVEELEKRLRGRKTEKEETIELRINNAKEELKRKDDFDYNVVNDDFDIAYKELKELVLKIIG